MKITNYINKIKLKIKKCYLEKRYKDALQYLYLCANLLYNYNQYYYDKDLEEYLEKISKSLLGDNQLKNINKDVVLFYDGFGLDKRGLAYIYMH